MRRMKTHLMLCTLAVGLCTHAAEESLFEFTESGQLAESQPSSLMEVRLHDVQEVYRELERVHAVYKEQVGAPSNEAELAAAVKSATQKLRPVCTRLRALPPAELRQLVLLADAIEWQSDWVRDSFMAEYAGADVQPRPCGLEIVAELSDFIGEALQHSHLSAQEEAALRELLSLFGGQDYLPMPRRLLDHRLAKDYKTAYQFFEEFTAASLLEDDDACLEKLNELSTWLEYLLQGGEADRLRVFALARAYEQALAAQKLPRPMFVFGEYMTASELKRKKVLTPFLKKLPELKRFFTIIIRCSM